MKTLFLLMFVGSAPALASSWTNGSRIECDLSSRVAPGVYHIRLEQQVSSDNWSNTQLQLWADEATALSRALNDGGVIQLLERVTKMSISMPSDSACDFGGTSSAAWSCSFTKPTVNIVTEVADSEGRVTERRHAATFDSITIHNELDPQAPQAVIKRFTFGINRDKSASTEGLYTSNCRDGWWSNVY